MSRDRYSNYATGVRAALPEAQQVADRLHVIKNLDDAVKKVLDRQVHAKTKKGYLSERRVSGIFEAAPVSLLLYRKVNEFHGRDLNLVNSLIKESPEIKTCHDMFQRFRKMLERKDRVL